MSFYKMCSGAELRKLPLKDLHKAKFNRGVDMKRVARIRKNFKREAAMPIMVSLRNGVYRILNGQHTCEVLLQELIFEWDCLIYRNLTEAQEAMLYFIFNTVPKSLNGTDKFYGAYVAEMKSALEVVRIVEENKLSIDRVHDVASPYFESPWELIKFFDKFQKHTKSDEIVLFSRFIKLLKIWKGQPSSLASHYMRALHSFVITTRDFSDNELFDGMKGSNAATITVKATDSMGKSKEVRSLEKHVKHELMKALPQKLLWRKGKYMYLPNGYDYSKAA